MRNKGNTATVAAGGTGRILENVIETQFSTPIRPARVVVGVTGSAGSAAALRRAVVEARRTGSELVPVFAWEPPGGERLYRTAPVPALAELWQRQARERLDAAIAEAVGEFPADLRVEPLVVRAPAVWALTELADGPGDLLVLGAGPRGRLARPFRGRVRRAAAERTSAALLLVSLVSRPVRVRRDLRRMTADDFRGPAGPGPAG